MKIVYLLLILIIACNPSTNTLGDNIFEKEVVNVKPLQVELESSTAEEELILDTTLNCVASEGVPPHTYSWSSNLECDSECFVYLDKIGNYEVNCTVTDSKGNRESSSLILKVIKKQVNVDQIITFGDSLTYGHGLKSLDYNWPTLLSKKFKNAELKNFAISGATTYSVKDYQIQQFNDSEKSKLVFLWIGSNDVKKFFDLNDFKYNYITILQELKKIKNAEVIVISIPDASKLPVADEIEDQVNYFLKDYGVEISVQDITSDIMNSYNKIVIESAEEYGFEVIDMFNYMNQFDELYISDDKFHPNRIGHKLLADKIYSDLVELYPETDFN